MRLCKVFWNIVNGRHVFCKRLELNCLRLCTDGICVSPWEMYYRNIYVYPADEVFCIRQVWRIDDFLRHLFRTGIWRADLFMKHFCKWKIISNPLKRSGHYMYHQFNIQQFYVLPTLYLCVLCGSENKERLFPYTALTDWFV